jgi:hypothetical protein
MERSYEIEPTENGWKLTMFEDGEEMGGAQAPRTDEDYDWLLQVAEQYCG